jgi:hypothetical protein
VQCEELAKLVRTGWRTAEAVSRDCHASAQAGGAVKAGFTEETTGAAPTN